MLVNPPHPLCTFWTSAVILAQVKKIKLKIFNLSLMGSELKFKEVTGKFGEREACTLQKKN